ncbi:MAG TPA: hypothetical protein VGO93_16255 [Candidatus Xenobia bacterium]
MFFKTYVAAFFMAHGSRRVGDVARLAGVSHAQFLDDRYKAALGILQPGREVMYGRWGAFGIAWTVLEVLETHTCLEIYFSQQHFVEQQTPNKVADLPMEYDPTLKMAYAFSDACRSLQPEVALVDARPHPEDLWWESGRGNPQWVLNQYPLVQNWDVNGIICEGYSLTYLSEHLFRLWESDAASQGRDVLPDSQGRVIFAGRGWYRWEG